MSAEKLNQVRESLSEKRSRLQEWIQTTPSDQKTVILGPTTEEAVHSNPNTTVTMQTLDGDSEHGVWKHNRMGLDNGFIYKGSLSRAFV